MSGLAQYNEVNGVSTPMTYGLVPNKASTWDYKMVYGCACDDGWMGYDCSERKATAAALACVCCGSDVKCPPSP